MKCGVSVNVKIAGSVAALLVLTACGSYEGSDEDARRCASVNGVQVTDGHLVGCRFPKGTIIIQWPDRFAREIGPDSEEQVMWKECVETCP